MYVYPPPPHHRSISIVFNINFENIQDINYDSANILA
jgi:hypothetical protein